MSQPPHENIDVPNPAPNIGTFVLHDPTLTILTNLPKQATTSIRLGHLFRRRIKNRREYPITSMAPDLYFHCIWKWQAKKTRRWRRAGKTTLMGSSYLCVVIIYFKTSIHANSLLVDRSILCCCCVVNLSVNSRPPAESSRYIQFLPFQHVSGYDSPE